MPMMPMLPPSDAPVPPMAAPPPAQVPKKKTKPKGIQALFKKKKGQIPSPY